MELATLFKEVFDVYFDAVKENPKASNPTVKELRTKIENELSPILQKYNLQISAIRGQGILRAKPFISLLSEGQKTSQGIYLIYFFDPDNRQVEFGFGDADHKPPPDALVKSFAKNCDEMLRRVGVIPDSYNDVHYPRLVYPLSNLDNKKLESDLTKFCDVYRTLSNEFRPQILEYLNSDDVTDDEDSESDDESILKDQNGTKDINVYLDEFEEGLETDERIKELVARENMPEYSQISRTFFQNLNDVDFIKFFEDFCNTGGGIQSGGQRSTRLLVAAIKARLSDFRNHILKTFDSVFSLEEWWIQANFFDKWGIGIRTIFLNKCRPEEFPILNNKSLAVFKDFGVTTINKDRKRPDLYLRYVDDLTNLRKQRPKLSYFKLDVFCQYITEITDVDNSLAQLRRYPAAARKLFEALLPDTEIRKAAILIFAKAIKATHEIDPNKWGVPLFESPKNTLRLNCGPIEIVVLEPEKFRIVVHKSIEPTLANQYTTSLWDKTVKDSFVLEMNHNQIPSVNNDILESQAYLLKTSHVPPLNVSAKGAHSPGVIEYLSKESGIPLSNPSYYGHESSNRRIWVIASGRAGEAADDFINGSYVALGMGDYNLGDLTSYSSSDDIDEKIQDEYTGKAVPVHDRKAIKYFLSKIKPNDIVILKAGLATTYGIGTIQSDYYYEPSTFAHRRKVNWIKTGEWSHPDNKYHGKTLTDYTKKVDNLTPILNLMGVDLNEIKDPTKLLIDKSTMNQPLNQIFFGPPGTGKTYTILELTKKFTESAATSSESERIKSLVKDLPWWQIVAAVLYDQGVSNVQRIMEHPLIDAKRQFSASRSLKQNIWGLLQRQTTLDCPNVNYTSRTAPYVFFKNEDSTWRIIKETVENEAPEVIDLLNALKSKPTNETIERYRLVTFHQSYSYEDFVEGIKPTLGETDEGLSYNIVPGTFKSIATEAANDPDHNYAIFIDEINRGNIANIFGELITLIEEDKRGLEIELPYSKEKFSIPKNLYIYGTMNTADRSVEALDTALRRRFAFTEMLPNAEFINTTKCGNIDLKVLLQTINSRIEKILDRDHTIGHSYFRDIYSLNDLRHAFKSKIIPLLQEYFYNDYSKIGRILGPAFLDESTSEISLIPFGPDPATEDERPIYRFKNIDNLAEQDFTAIYTTT